LPDELCPRKYSQVFYKIKNGGHVRIEFCPGVFLPEHVVREIPKEVPVGLSLVVFQRVFHGEGGWPYDWRYFALPPGMHVFHDLFNDVELQVVHGNLHVFSTLDCNGEISYALPEGSMEYHDGCWESASQARYYQ